jgi:hypothetical protein
MGKTNAVLVKAEGSAGSLSSVSPPNMELKMSHYANLYEATAQQILAAQFKRAEQNSKSRIITHYQAPRWKKLWWRIRLFFINRRYARRLRKI